MTSLFSQMQLGNTTKKQHTDEVLTMLSPPAIVLKMFTVLCKTLESPLAAPFAPCVRTAVYDVKKNS